MPGLRALERRLNSATRSHRPTCGCSSHRSGGSSRSRARTRAPAGPARRRRSLTWSRISRNVPTFGPPAARPGRDLDPAGLLHDVDRATAAPGCRHQHRPAVAGQDGRQRDAARGGAWRHDAAPIRAGPPRRRRRTGGRHGSAGHACGSSWGGDDSGHHTGRRAGRAHGTSVRGTHRVRTAARARRDGTGRVAADGRRAAAARPDRSASISASSSRGASRSPSVAVDRDADPLQHLPLLIQQRLPAPAPEHGAQLGLRPRSRCRGRSHGHRRPSPAGGRPCGRRC